MARPHSSECWIAIPLIGCFRRLGVSTYSRWQKRGIPEYDPAAQRADISTVVEVHLRSFSEVFLDVSGDLHFFRSSIQYPDRSFRDSFCVGERRTNRWLVAGTSCLRASTTACCDVAGGVSLGGSAAGHEATLNHPTLAQGVFDARTSDRNKKDAAR